MDKKISIVHLVPLVATCVFTYLCTYILVFSNISELVEMPFMKEETYYATLYNTMLLLSLIVIGSLMLYILIKFKKVKILEAIVKVLVASSIYSIVTIYVASICILLGLEYVDLLVFNITVLVLTVIFSYLVLFTKKGFLAAFSTLLLGVSIGTLFGVTLPPWTVLAAAATVALWDVYAVFKGPLRALVDEIKSKEKVQEETYEPSFLRGIALSFKGLIIGLGDIVFYSMLMSLALSSPKFSLERFILVSLSIVVGAYITLKTLEKGHRALPGLPIPVFLGITTYIILSWINI